LDADCALGIGGGDDENGSLNLKRWPGFLPVRPVLPASAGRFPPCAKTAGPFSASTGPGEIAAARAIEDSIRHERNGLHRRMQAQKNAFFILPPIGKILCRAGYANKEKEGKFPLLTGNLQGILPKSGRLAKNCPQERSKIS